MIRHTPQFEHGACNKRFEGLFDTGVFDVVGIGGCIWWRVVMFDLRHVSIVAVVRMLSPPNVHLGRIGIVEFVVIMGRPLDVEAGSVGTTEAIIERDGEHRWIEIIV
nr:hypothetical protein [Halogranum salarium]